MSVREEARVQARDEYSHAKVRDRYDADLMMAGFEDGAVWQADRETEDAEPVAPRAHGCSAHGWCDCGGVHCAGGSQCLGDDCRDAEPVAGDVDRVSWGEGYVAGMKETIKAFEKDMADAEPVAYEVRRPNVSGVMLIVQAEDVSDQSWLHENARLTPLYRAPHPAKPIEVTDAMVLAALNEHYGEDFGGLDGWTDESQINMRAAIEAALKEAGK